MIIFPNTIKNILVTGGSGFIGGTLIRRLLNETNLKVFNLDKIGYASNLSGFKNQSRNISNHSNRYQLLNINLANKEQTNNAIKKISPDIVFHLAAQPLVRESYLNPRKTWSTNVIGSLNLLDSLKEYRKNVK